VGNNVVLTAIITASLFCVFFVVALYYLSRLRDARKSADSLEKKTLRQELIIALVGHFISSKDTDVTINNALMMIVMVMNVSRAFLARLDAGILSFENEWVDAKLDLKSLLKIGIEFKTGNIFYDTFVLKGDVYLLNDNSNRDASVEQYLGLFELKNCIFVPIIMDGKIWGILGVEEHSEGFSWKADDQFTVRNAANTMISFIVKIEADKAMAMAKEQAEMANLTKSSFLARMSHEMRTPMNAVIGMATIALNSKEKDKMEHCLVKIREASLHLIGVINDILDMSKIEAGKFDLAKTEFDFEQMIDRVTNIVRYKADEKKHNLILRIDRDIPARVIADEQRIAQVLVNLLSNAVKFTPDNGTVTMSAQLLESGEDNCKLRFNVIDSGIGITEEQKSRLFMPFEQADGSISRSYGGTGLGLAIAKNIIELMSGKIRVESEPGNGSDFEMEVVLEKGTPVTQHTSNRLVWENLRILAVDDSPEDLEYYIKYCGHFNITCITAKDGADACRILDDAANLPIDIIFTHWHMPNMDGVELAKYAKSRFGGNVAVVLVSDAWQENDQKSAEDASIYSVIQKPLFPSEITETINSIILKNKGDEKEAAEKGPGEIFTGSRIIVAEDIEINREIVSSFLENTGIQIDFAENGKQAVEMFAANQEKYDLILMDVHMPEIDGLEATKRIRQIEGAGKEIPIIAMTANVFKEDIEKCLASGMNDHFGKPIDFGELIIKLKKYLP
jgi:signal transduction histidine kinase/DNA-binding response OmpR family regulator